MADKRQSPANLHSERTKKALLKLGYTSVITVQHWVYSHAYRAVVDAAKKERPYAAPEVKDKRLETKFDTWWNKNSVSGEAGDSLYSMPFLKAMVRRAYHCGHETLTLDVAMFDLDQYGPGVRRDFGGFADYIAFGGNNRTLAVQVCSHAAMGAHLTKMRNNERTAEHVLGWLEDAHLQIWGWKKPKHRWELTTQVITPADIDRRF